MNGSTDKLNQFSTQARGNENEVNSGIFLGTFILILTSYFMRLQSLSFYQLYGYNMYTYLFEDWVDGLCPGFRLNVSGQVIFSFTVTTPHPD